MTEQMALSFDTPS